ncbi:MAG: hypothetical protein ACOX52_15320 [Verrucomicrobiota bacterium]
MSESGSIPVLVGTRPSERCSNLAAEFCQHRNNTVAQSDFSFPNPIPRPFDTETDSHPDPDLALPWTFSGDLWSEDSGHRGHRDASHFPSGNKRTVPPMAKGRISL